MRVARASKAILFSLLERTASLRSKHLSVLSLCKCT
jgi:hypothetical protein